MAIELLSEKIRLGQKLNGKLYTLEGLDGSGKSTVGAYLSSAENNSYVYCTDGSRLKSLRKIFDQSPVSLRFLYYFALSLETRKRALHLQEAGKNVFVDRYLPSTVAYHKAMGLNSRWQTIIPAQLWNEITAMIYIHADPQERLRRLAAREKRSRSDKFSTDLVAKVEAEYKKILPDRTIIIDNSYRSPEETTAELLRKIYEK